MSTLMSTDMSYERSATRRHAPPGGKSTFSVGWGNDQIETVRLVGGNVVSVSEKAHSVVSERDVSIEICTNIEGEQKVVDSDEKQDKVDEPTVGMVVVGGASAKHLTSCATKALAQVGLLNVVVVEVAYSSMLVAASQKLLNRSGIGGVLALFVAAPHQQPHAANQEVALLQLGNISSKPVIPGIVCQSSLLEANGIIPILAVEWAGAIAGLLKVDYSEVQTIEPVVLVPCEPKEDECDPDVLLDIYREALKAYGATGIFGLQRKFRIIDDDNSNSICFDEFSKAIAEASLTWSEAQRRILFDRFDRDKNGTISFDEFLHTVRGVLNERRQKFVLMAFEILDSDKNGTIELSDISSKYDASKHPDVISGKRSVEDILKQFLDTFDGTDKDGKVTYVEFSEYYANLSASIDDDDYFELMMRNSWHISGGDGWCANSSCRRVLVTHSDGRQTVEEIKNDIGISDDDEESILANLQSQGLSDLTLVELNSGKKVVVEPNIAIVVSDTASETSSAPSTPSRRVRGVNNASFTSTIILG